MLLDNEGAMQVASKLQLNVVMSVVELSIADIALLHNYFHAVTSLNVTAVSCTRYCPVF